MADGKRAEMAEKVKEKKRKTMGEEAAVLEEVDVDDLKGITGGSIHDVHYTDTDDISSDTKSKI